MLCRRSINPARMVFVSAKFGGSLHRPSLGDQTNLNIMGKVVFEDPVHHISGKISKKFRTTYNYRKASERKYTSVRGERTTPVSADEIAQRLKFKTIRLAALARSKDLAHMSQDQEAYKAEKKAQGASFKYSTYLGWLFGKGFLYYNETTKQVDWPEEL